MTVEEQLDELLAKLNEAASTNFKYSAKITTNAKGEAQIHASVKGNESVDDTAILLQALVKEVKSVLANFGLRLPTPK